jgi:hypothetical protein
VQFQSEPESLAVISKVAAVQGWPLSEVPLYIRVGEQLVYIREHPDNEHWWEATNSEGHSGYVPSSYVILKDDQSLPWLEQKALMEREKERKERALRHVQQQEMTEGKGFGPPPKQTDKPYTYVSAYNRQPASSTSSSGTVTSYYCDVCEKSFNGPKPYKAHMLSKAHKEELQLRQEEEEQSYN